MANVEIPIAYQVEMDAYGEAMQLPVLEPFLEAADVIMQHRREIQIEEIGQGHERWYAMKIPSWLGGRGSSNDSAEARKQEASALPSQQSDPLTDWAYQIQEDERSRIERGDYGEWGKDNVPEHTREGVGRLVRSINEGGDKSRAMVESELRGQYNGWVGGKAKDQFEQLDAETLDEMRGVGVEYTPDGRKSVTSK